MEQFNSVSPGRLSPICLLLLIVLFAAGAALRFYRLGTQSLWLDEALAMENTTGRGFTHETLPKGVWLESPPRLTTPASSWTSIWSSLGRDTHPPLHFVLLRIWRDAFGKSEAAARSLSAVVSLGALALLFMAGSTVAETSSTLWGVAFMALAPVQIRFAQEARNYELLIFFAVAATLPLLRIEKYGFSYCRGFALAACVLAMMLTHYFGAFVVLAMAAYSLFCLSGRTRRDTLAAIGAAVMTFVIVWGPFFFQQRQNFAAQDIWLRQEGGSLRRLLSVASHIVFLPARYFVAAEAEPARKIWWSPLLYLSPCLMLVRQPKLSWWVAWAIVSIGAIAALDIFRSTQHLSYIRYTLAASPAIYMILASSGISRHLWLKHLLPAALCTLCLLFLPQAYIRKSDWRGVGEQINAGPSGALIIVAGSNKIPWQAGALYLCINHYVKEAHPTLLIDSPVSESLLQRVHDSPTTWLFSSSQAETPEKLIPGFASEREKDLLGLGSLYRVTSSARDADSAAGQLFIRTDAEVGATVHYRPRFR